MKRRVFIFALSWVFVVGSFNFTSYALSKKNLYDDLNSRKVVRVFVAEASDSTDEKAADKASLRDLIENALSARMTINFDVVSRKEDADILIRCDIAEYIWKDKGPLDVMAGARLLAGAMKSGNFARMQVEFAVVDAKTEKVMWKKKIKATISDATMSRSDSILMINEKIVKVFVREAFSRSGESE